jgi:L-rhamnose mutarotase
VWPRSRIVSSLLSQQPDVALQELPYLVHEMFSIGQLLKLKPGCKHEYKRRHDELWPEMAEAMKRSGVSMVIYVYEHLLFIYATAPDQRAWDELERDPVTPKWDKFMSDVLMDDGNGRYFFKNLERMFAFGDFAL